MATSMVVRFQAEDGTALQGTLHQPSVGVPHTALLVNSGTGIPRRFYGKFAAYAAGEGFATLTHDYRGIGDSAPDSLRGYHARYRDWGQLDVRAAIDWMRREYASMPLAVVGHSTGGQQLGLAANVSQVRAALFIAVSSGYWKAMPAPFRWLTLALFRCYLPLVSPLYGYAPAKKIGCGENLPSGVAREWGSWCMEPDYLAAYLDRGGRRRSLDGRAFGPAHFEELRCPLLVYGFDDDPIATRRNVAALMPLFNRAQVESRWWGPQELGLREIGHLNFFRESVGKPLWQDALLWLRCKAHG